jgi:hypothetical protein
MARGWESKSVEDQIAAREDARSGAAAPAPTPAEIARDARRNTLLLARARAMQDLQIACDKRHRALLEQTIAHLDLQLNGI